MYKILSREDLAPNIHQFEIEAPSIARKAQPGQFIIIMVDEKGERIPLTIADWNRENGSIFLVFNVVGQTTNKLAAVQVGESIMSLSGPMGLPAEIDKFGTVVTVTSGYSVVTIVPVVQALKEMGNRVISIMRAPTMDSVFGQEHLGAMSDELIVTIGDNSCNGEPNFVTEPLEKLLKAEQIDRVITVGPVCVMKLVASVTRPHEVKTIASLNPIMVDGTGMCGCCRVSVGGKTMFACVDGPEFDAHEVDWPSLMARRCTYASNERGWSQYRCLDCAQW
ncbi:MAG: sulfide/dihydroorotate dehydrogenase-like FAD/NAD-binding protein [Dehalococcoidales bacterium]|nr:MAG: sulfide/dihydroorotate dehydrogenase-like FAD/NAD-binding protein [Dehalococcoidales bacterium]